MSKRQDIQNRRRQQHLRNQILVIVLVVVGALILTYVLIQPYLSSKSASAATTIIPLTPVPTSSYTAQKNGTHLGDPNAPVKMDLWEDFQCSGCLYYTLNIEPQILTTFVDTGKVYYSYHFFPLIDQGNPTGESHMAADAAMCANAQGRFWDMHAALFGNWIGENAGSFTAARLQAIAASIHLDMTAYNTCFQANTYSEEINADYQAGQTAGVTATPGIFINEKMAVASAGANYIPTFSDLSNQINAALNGK
jgi:protein-disulfide isomerase